MGDEQEPSSERDLSNGWVVTKETESPTGGESVYFLPASSSPLDSAGLGAGELKCEVDLVPRDEECTSGSHLSKHVQSSLNRFL